MWCQSPLDFEDGLLPLYSGEMGWSVEQFPLHHWGVDSLNHLSGNYSLHHSFDNPQAGCDYFILQHFPFRRSLAGESVFSGDSLSFSFRVRHSYPPSSGNNWQFAILAEFGRDLKGENIREGLVLGVNFVGHDDMVKLWRIHDGVPEELCVSALNFQEDIGVTASPFFKLSWQWDGDLSLWYASDTLIAMQKIASCILYDLPVGRSLVLRYEYSAAQDRKLWVDDLHLQGRFVADTVAPVVSGWAVEDHNTLKISFTEPINCTESSRMNLFPSSQPPDSFLVDAQNLLLYFPSTFPNREPLSLLVQGVCDRDGNRMTDTLIQFMRNEAEWGDLVISEVMADPDPPVFSSLGEYVELLNRSEYSLKLEGWRLEVGGRVYQLDTGEGGNIIGPGEFMVLSPLLLANQGALLALYNKEGILVHAASYQVPYNAPLWKREGGWSLESPDPDRVCSTSQLWEYSEDKSGGTPGEENSVDGERPDTRAPRFLYFGYGDEGELTLYFSEAIRIVSNPYTEVVLNPGKHRAIQVIASQPITNSLICKFQVDPSLLSRFTFNMPEVSDCSGNLLQKIQFNGGPAFAPAKGSVLINEIMYDPLDGAAEYIELYNAGLHHADIRELAIDVTSEGEDQKRLIPLSDHSRILGPGEYLVLTRSIAHLMNSYDLEISGSWVELEDIVSLPNEEGQVWLMDRSGNGIDIVSYGDKMHMEIFSDTRGISLERIDPGRSGIDPGNWHSAASIADYATPGSLNSQSLPDLHSELELIVEPRVFSPDNDGYHDLLVISPGIEEAGSVLRIWITRPDGALVRILANNHIAGASSQYTWDGRDDGGAMGAEGFYVVHLRAYNPISGASRNTKRAVGLIYR